MDMQLVVAIYKAGYMRGLTTRVADCVSVIWCCDWQTVKYYSQLVSKGGMWQCKRGSGCNAWQLHMISLSISELRLVLSEIGCWLFGQTALPLFVLQCPNEVLFKRKSGELDRLARMSALTVYACA